MISNHNTANLTKSQKHLGIVLDLEIIFKKVSKGIGFLRRLKNLLPRKSLITVHKSFTRPHLDYGSGL